MPTRLKRRGAEHAELMDIEWSPAISAALRDFPKPEHPKKLLRSMILKSNEVVELNTLKKIAQSRKDAEKNC
jgi:hypothetical protein